MTDRDVTTVSSATDVRDAHADVDGRAVAVIRRHVEDGATVAWVAAWLLEDGDKDLRTVEGHDQVAVGDLQRETEKAWQLDQPDTDAEPVWLPKSQARIFRLAEGVTDVASDQRTLEDLS